jgi:broad specificity phosphatase PhoE
MKYLFLGRHGDYYDSGLLSDEGRSQVEKLGYAIKGVLGDSSAYLVSSTFPRVIGSSEVLAPIWGLERFEELSYLYDFNDEFYPESFKNSMKMIDERRNRAEGLVLLSHQDITWALSSYFMKKEFNSEESIDKTDFGEAIYFDLEKGVYQFLSIRE